MNPLRIRKKTSIDVMNIAHRGARAYAPENTLVAFEKARTFGCHMFELDVHMSKDGELIVFHDDQLTRCTNVNLIFPGRASYYISDFTYDELSLLDAGNWYVEQLRLPISQRQSFLQTLSNEELEQFVSSKEREFYASGEIKIPTLQQSLELAMKSGMMVNIELKTLPRMYPGLADAVIRLIDSMELEKHVLVSSFDHEQLIRVRDLTNNIATGILTSDRLAKVDKYLQLLDADAYNPCCYGENDSIGFNSVNGLLDLGGIQNCRDSGYGVNVWTCNDKDKMLRLIGVGVTGLISDFPNRVRDVLTECQTFNV